MLQPLTPASTATQPRWPATVSWAHWATLALLVTGLVALGLRELADARALRDALLAVHRWAGALAWVAGVARLLLRWIMRGQARPQVPGPAALRWLAVATHALLYALLLATPLLGAALASARGLNFSLPGLGSLLLGEPDPERAEDLIALHANAAWALLGLVALHAAAAAWHHLVRGDDVLRGMWPARRRSVPFPTREDFK